MADIATLNEMETATIDRPSIPFILPTLRYGFAALEPAMSEITLRTHFGKHHAKYVEVTNRLLAEANKPFGDLESVIKYAYREGGGTLFNNAAQAWNHGFFWESMSAGDAVPSGAVADALALSPESVESCKARFIAAGISHFGSGWLWLVVDDGNVSVMTTHDAGSLAAMTKLTPLLVCDLWEHAYYLDYKQDRAAWLGQWWDHLANWAFANAQLGAALGRGNKWRYPVAGRDRTDLT